MYTSSTEWWKDWDINLKKFKYYKIVDCVYFKASYELNIKQLNIGDFFVIEIFPIHNSNARSEKFYGKLLRKTSTSFSCYRYCSASFNEGNKEFIYKKSMDSYEKSPVQFFNNKIKNLRKVDIYEKKEKVILTSTVDPSTFMDAQDYKLLKW